MNPKEGRKGRTKAAKKKRPLENPKAQDSPPPARSEVIPGTEGLPQGPRPRPASCASMAVRAWGHLPAPCPLGCTPPPHAGSCRCSSSRPPSHSGFLSEPPLVADDSRATVSPRSAWHPSAGGPPSWSTTLLVVGGQGLDCPPLLVSPTPRHWEDTKSPAGTSAAHPALSPCRRPWMTSSRL